MGGIGVRGAELKRERGWQGQGRRRTAEGESEGITLEQEAVWQWWRRRGGRLQAEAGRPVGEGGLGQGQGQI